MAAKHFEIVATLCFLFTWSVNLPAQEETPSPTTSDSATSEPFEGPAPADQPQTEQVLDDVQKKAGQLASDVDQSPQAQKVTAGILEPIYKLAEFLSFPLFHWIAFALMATGVVSYALQLVLAKLVVLTRMGFSPAEILSDALGLAISVIGLVLTTQAAAENSTFTQSPASVLSATAVGIVCGFIFYRWGQSQEVQATIARSRGAGAAK
jgi:hypothetical protein